MFDNQIQMSPTQTGIIFSPENNILDMMMSPDKKEKATPLLFVDVNLGGEEPERIVVYEGDTAYGLAVRFCEEHGLDEDTIEKLEVLLKSQMDGLLLKIEEDEEDEASRQ